MSIADIEIRHLGGQIVTVPIVQFTETELLFTWPMAGVFRLRVKGNKIVGLPAWKAVDHEKIKKLHWQLKRARDQKYDRG